MKIVKCLTILFLISILLPAGSSFGAIFGEDTLERSVLIIDPGGTVTLSGARTALSRAGVKGILCYPPNVIAGYFPSDLDETLVDGARIAISESELEAYNIDRVTLGVVSAFLRGDFENDPTPRAMEGGSEIDHALNGPGLSHLDLPAEGVFLDSEVPDEIKRALAPPRAEGRRSGSPFEIAERGIDQNSEFLIGTVLVNIVFPEGLYGIESWTDEEIEDAVRGMSAGISRIQQIAHWVDLSFMFNHNGYHKIPVTYDFIDTNVLDGSEQFTVGEAMTAIGYDASAAGTFAAVHNFNNDMRVHFGTDWVFSVFVADQSAHYDPSPVQPDPGCWGGNGYTINPMYGGPYIAIPYPACWRGYGDAFSNLFAVGVFRIFWGEFEHDSSAAHCEPEHGYLAVPNLNSIHIYLGQTEPCGFGEPCLMHTPGFEPYFPVCEYTLGQVGLGDENSNSVPDVYEMAPELRVIYVPGFNSDTTFDGTYLISAVATNDAVPNLNPAQPALTRIDYAPTLVKGWIQINSDLEVDLLPGDNVWDESREDLSHILLEGLEPGLNVLNLRVENNVGLRDAAQLEVTYIGMKFFETGIETRPEGITVDWQTSDLIFGADFELMKQDLSTGGAKQLVAVVDGEDFVEVGAKRKVFRYLDEDIEQGHLYSYSVVSRFEAMKDGVLTEFVDECPAMVGRAVVKVNDRMVSSILPNPMGPGCSEVVFTMDIPRSYWSPSGSRVETGEGIRYRPSDIEIKTDVKVSVYDVKGQLVRDVFELPVFGGLITKTWDGKDKRGSNLAQGIYFMKVTAGGIQEVRKIVIFRQGDHPGVNPHAFRTKLAREFSL